MLTSGKRRSFALLALALSVGGALIGGCNKGEDPTQTAAPSPSAPDTSPVPPRPADKKMMGAAPTGTTDAAGAATGAPAAAPAPKK